MIKIALSVAVILAIWFDLAASAAAFGIALGLAAQPWLASLSYAPEPPSPPATLDYLADDAALLFHLVVNPPREVCYAA